MMPNVPVVPDDRLAWPRPADDLLWKLDKVSLTGARRRLDQLQLEIPLGVTAVLGASGAGKTSLLNLLVQYERPTHGEVRRILAGTAEHAVGWVPQGFSLWPHLNAEQHIQTVLPGYLESASETRKWLQQFELSDHCQVSPHQLSAGQQSRLSVARALASQANVLVMDEPLANVDPAHERDYWEIIAAHVSGSRSLVFTSHNIEAVYRLAETIICLDAGKVVFRGPLSELYSRPTSRRQAEFLGPVNWFEEGQAHRWLVDAPPTTTIVRPEEMEVERVPESPVRVESWRFLGQTAILELKHVDTGERRDVLRLGH
ncbi:MAG: ATP-binding cassette domain-containing protein [Planctomycetota bacterium]|nr:ATP-binding cassette domain-containing protein [Planctomycetota bacterium]MDA1179213.1 ATP-binding cassette domain-containing protein [Planctomycetota bacterium]